MMQGSVQNVAETARQLTHGHRSPRCRYSSWKAGQRVQSRPGAASSTHFVLSMAGATCPKNKPCFENGWGHSFKNTLCFEHGWNRFFKNALCFEHGWSHLFKNTLCSEYGWGLCSRTRYVLNAAGGRLFKNTLCFQYDWCLVCKSALCFQHGCDHFAE